MPDNLSTQLHSLPSIGKNVSERCPATTLVGFDTNNEAGNADPTDH
jgi:hypothetical protein